MGDLDQLYAASVMRSEALSADIFGRESSADSVMDLFETRQRKSILKTLGGADLREDLIQSRS